MGIEELLRTVREFAEKQQAAGQGGWQGGVLKAVADMAQPAEAVARDIRTGEPPAVEDIAATGLNLGGMLPGAKSIGLAGSLIGAGAKSWRPSMERLAMDMFLKGKATPEEILQATGLSLGKADWKWRGEISDLGAELTPEAMDAADKIHRAGKGSWSMPMSRAIEHPEFAAEYPNRFSKSEVVFKPGKGSEAKYVIKDPEHTVLTIGTTSWDNPKQRKSIPELLDAFFHENTHGTQINEGYATGTYPNDPQVIKEAARLGITPHQVYHRTPGEAEARNYGEVRRDLAESLLRQIHPKDTSDPTYPNLLWYMKGNK